MRNHRQLQPSQNDLISDPVAQLHQISNEEDQDNTTHQTNNNVPSRFSLSNKLVSPKIFNKKLPAGLDSTEEISEWTGISPKQKTHLSKFKSQTITKYQSHSARSTQFQNWLKNRIPINEGQFLSMADLCHRYTFINQHTSNQQTIFEAEFGKKQLHPNNVEIKLEVPPPQCMRLSKYKTNPKFKKASEKSESKFRLPQILKMESEGQNISQRDPSDQVKSLLQYIKKSTSNKKIAAELVKNKEKAEHNQSIIHDRNSIVKQKINWRGGPKHRADLEFEKLWQNRRIKAEKKDKVNHRYSPLFFNQYSSEYKQKQEDIKKSLGHRARGKLSKSLQQCLILSRKR